MVSNFYITKQPARVCVSMTCLSIHPNVLAYKPLCLNIVTGKEFKLEYPSGDELPQKVPAHFQAFSCRTFSHCVQTLQGFDPGQDTYQAPPSGLDEPNVDVDPSRYESYKNGVI